MTNACLSHKHKLSFTLWGIIGDAKKICFKNIIFHTMLTCSQDGNKKAGKERKQSDATEDGIWHRSA